MKQDVESILLANWYLTLCKIENKSKEKSEVARKYLLAKINEALFERKNKIQSNRTIEL
jgi:hypothetical protein